jgi:FAD synthase
LEESKEILDEARHLIATQLQVAMINKMLPKGFKFESLETVKRQIEQSK